MNSNHKENFRSENIDQDYFEDSEWKPILWESSIVYEHGETF